jgi:hypothetical protein
MSNSAKLDLSKYPPLKPSATTIPLLHREQKLERYLAWRCHP